STSGAYRDMRYVEANPVVRTDPTGRCSTTKCWIDVNASASAGVSRNENMKGSQSTVVVVHIKSHIQRVNDHIDAAERPVLNPVMLCEASPVCTYDATNGNHLCPGFVSCLAAYRAGQAIDEMYLAYLMQGRSREEAAALIVWLTRGIVTDGPHENSRGSTGRSAPANLKEQLAMEQAMSDPEAGVQLPLSMSDTRWPASDGWVKMSQDINGVEIHYVYNTSTGAVDDFKFAAENPEMP